MAAYYWTRCEACNIPRHAVRGGTDSDGTAIYVGRAYHEGDFIPAKVIPEKEIAYVAYSGKEHAIRNCEVLCETRFEWVHSSNGHVPCNAVEGGRTSHGEPLYIGRVHHENSHTVGKVHPSHGCCYIPYDGRELRYDHYEILVLQV